MSFKKNIKFKYIKNSLVLLSVILIVIASPYIVYFSTSKIATIYINKKDYDLAEYVYKFGIKFENLFFDLMEIQELKLKDKLAKTYIYKENYSNAKKIYLENIEIRKNKYPNAVKEIENNYFNLAIISQKIKNHKEEKKYFDKLYEYKIIKNQNKQLFDDIPTHTMQEFYKNNYEYNKVLTILKFRQKAKKNKQFSYTQKRDWQIDMNLAEAYGYLSDFEKAEFYFKKSINFLETELKNNRTESDYFICDEYITNNNCPHHTYIGLYEKYGDFILSQKKDKIKAKNLYLKQIQDLNKNSVYKKQINNLEQKLQNLNK